MTFYQIIVTCTKGIDYPSTLIYESKDEAHDKMGEFASQLQGEILMNGDNIQLDKVRVKKLTPVFTKSTKRDMTINKILKD